MTVFRDSPKGAGLPYTHGVSRLSTIGRALICAAPLTALCGQDRPGAADERPLPGHWAFREPVATEVPAVADSRFAAQDIDRFVAARLADEGLTPAPRADRRSLIRRVTFDLTGLPPTLGEIRAFLADESPDAYERLVDDLLKRPAYGEQMARSWLDAGRFADTNGVHHDHYRDLSPYRDWVIRAFRDNLPYDRFVIDQIAGDLHPEPSTDQLVASGFHRLHLIIDRGTMLPEESLTRNVIDRVTAFGTAFLGLTVHCAVCHDHKYDPIRQREFFELYAFFDDFDGAPETGSRSGSDFRRGLQPPYVDLPSPEQRDALDRVHRGIAELGEKIQTAERDGDETTKQGLLAERKLLERERDGILRDVPAAMVMRERAEERPAHVLVRGQYDRPGAPVARGVPAFLPPLEHDGETPSRMDLARWVVDPANPLTARVFVNRVWQQFFGVGIVKTSEDLGTQGERPTHPGLLDHLAVSFVESGWDVKALVRRIVLSETYRQASSAAPAAFAADPENRLLARGPRFRMDAEMIRDAMLATSGLLNRELFGRSVKPPQPAGLWKAVALPDSYPRVHVADTGPDAHRRSLYTFWKRGLPPPQMTILDAPSREACVTRRERTNTPLQALLLMNEEQCVEASRHLALRAIVARADDTARVEWLWETVTATLPDATERDALLGLAADLRRHYAAYPAAARALGAGPARSMDPAAATELATWTVVASTVYNLDITKTKG